MIGNLSIDRRILWKYVNKKINRIIHYYHVCGVIAILFDEILKDLKAGKTIKIYNFGRLALRETKSRKYYDVRHQKVMQSDPHKILNFFLAPQIRKILRSHLDI